MSHGFSETPQELFFSRHDASDPRLGERTLRLAADENEIEKLNETERNFILSGYADDEGIRLNGGRVGAALAPDRIRKYFYKMTPHLNLESQFKIFDRGNLDTSVTLASRHELVRARIAKALEHGATWIGLGGGHDYGYADGAGFIDWCRTHKQKPLIINFDAHLDVRPSDKNLNSGTPFFRLLELEPEAELLQIGIQNHCNSSEHWRWCLSRNAKILTFDEILVSGTSPLICFSQFFEDVWIRRRPTYLSIDIDAFSSAFAPGCSQSWATGITPFDFLPLLDLLTARLDIKVMGIYEVSPPLDSDDRTSKLAAQILHRFVSSAKGTFNV
jgi:formiminoglutamase